MPGLSLELSSDFRVLETLLTSSWVRLLCDGDFKLLQFSKIDMR